MGWVSMVSDYFVHVKILHREISQLSELQEMMHWNVLSSVSVCVCVCQQKTLRSKSLIILHSTNLLPKMNCLIMQMFLNKHNNNKWKPVKEEKK